MSSAGRPFVESLRLGLDESGHDVGPWLKSLREAAGLTQLQMADRLGVRQAAISKFEQRGEPQFSTLRRYIEALEGNLQIGAVFPEETGMGTALQNITLQNINGERVNDGTQYILPIFDYAHATRRDLVLSIKPAYTEKIFKGKKTIELRRRFPVAAGKGAVAYIYSTAPVQALVGTAEITSVERLPVAILWRQHGQSASIEKRDFDAYFSGLEEGYALRISKARQFSRPFNLVELKERFGFKAPQSFLYAKPNLQEMIRNESSNLSD